VTSWLQAFLKDPEDAVRIIADGVAQNKARIDGAKSSVAKIRTMNSEMKIDSGDFRMRQGQRCCDGAAARKTEQ
jgi:hypothetical protein